MKGIKEALDANGKHNFPRNHEEIAGVPDT
jgi:hypothetical protein